MDLPANPQPGDRLNVGQRMLEWTGARWVLVAEQGTLIPGPAGPDGPAGPAGPEGPPGPAGALDAPYHWEQSSGSGTWTKPAGAYRTAIITLSGGGGGGGRGYALGAAGTAVSGAPRA